MDFDYTISNELRPFFDNKLTFFYEYLIKLNCEKIPESILNVPFVMNLMPLIWLSDAVLFVRKLDKNFYESLKEIKKGFQRVYPKIKFGGRLIVDQLEENHYIPDNRTTIFFTGGVDATASLINQIKNFPQPFYILGADVKLSETENLEAAQKDIPELLAQFGLSCSFIRSSVRFFFDGIKLSDYFENQLHDSWWHGAQHSIGMLSLMAPYAFMHRIKACIIAASFTKEAEGKINCCSFPFIDDALRFGDTFCYHDGYQMSRQEKINSIVSYGKRHNIKMNLRVCFMPHNGTNCNKCEKCMRTIMSLRATGADPNQYGFSADSELYKNIHQYLKTHLLYHTAHWNGIQKEFKKNRSMFENEEDIRWIFHIRFNSPKIYMLYARNKLVRGIKSMLRR